MSENSIDMWIADFPADGGGLLGPRFQGVLYGSNECGVAASVQSTHDGSLHVEFRAPVALQPGFAAQLPDEFLGSVVAPFPA